VALIGAVPTASLAPTFGQGGKDCENFRSWVTSWVDDAMRDENEDAREQRFWGAVIRSTETALIILLVVGVLASLTWALGWRKYLLLCFVGFGAGIAIGVSMLSKRGRELVGPVLGGITLPLIGVHLAGVAATNETAFARCTDGLVPFIAHAAGPVLAMPSISWIWRRRAEHPESELLGEPRVREGATP